MRHIKLFEKWILTLEKEGGNEFGCMMLYVKFPQMEQIHSIIDEEDVYEPKTHGLEKEPHITLLYGLHDEEVDGKNLFDDCEIEGEIWADNVSAFKNDEYDVLKFDAHGDCLYQSNKNLVKHPHTNNYPDYHPHMTIAYLKKGTSDKYIEKLKNKKYNLSPSELVYSDPQTNKIRKKV